ncbi:hypothetical protein F8388_020204 [Cannabis sativa]|uniref:Hydrophobic seed protein domain-containing protein n=1 Tax=Cannabis sativa TaxID=3483 RepID=A0A7J6FV99_CANSA|nr:hypothetical protein F8388_020204 [Cannabis sativa]
MNSKAQVSIVFFLSLNLVFFTMVSSTCHNGICPPPPFVGHHRHHLSPPNSRTICSLNPLKFGCCGHLISNLGDIIIGTPGSSPCCNLLLGLIDLEAAWKSFLAPVARTCPLVSNGNSSVGLLVLPLCYRETN